MKRILTSREYSNATNLYSDLTRQIVRQKRYTFIYENQCFAVHSYLSPVAGINILHCQIANSDVQSIVFPPFLEVGEQLSDDGHLSAYKISLKDLISA